MALTTKITIDTRSTLTGVVGLSINTALVNQKPSTELTAVATDSIFTVTGTIAGGAVSYDLAGSLTDPLGDAVVFAKVMSVFVINNDAATSMTVGGVNNIPMLGSGDVMNIGPGAYFQWINENGITVTAGTGDLITVTGTDGDTFDLIIIGSST